MICWELQYFTMFRTLLCGGEGNIWADPRVVNTDGPNEVSETADDDLRASGTSQAVDGQRIAGH